MKVISVSENPEYRERAIAYFIKHWANKDSEMVYRDCITHCGTGPLPKWYLLMDGDTIAGGAGLISNDFISRMDLYPWLCALYVEREYRGNGYGNLLIQRGKEDARAAGFPRLYLCSDHVGYYEHYGFSPIGTGYHPWGETSGIFMCEL
ncbi:MAG: GNAT family N-acetyltransferase [Clostridiales bacterium]|nr:GNAT family N-acetyltransferase [Clostridiales bacterium]